MLFPIVDIRVVALRLGLALLFGAIAGIEREWRHKAAGVKTNALVSIGSAVFALMSNTFGALNHNPAQLAAAVVGGIGFIGAGVIIHRGPNVQGVTTAATLWANASVGVALGLGFYGIGTLAFLGIVIVQFGMRRVVDAIAGRGPRMREIELRIECAESALGEVNRAWTAFATKRNIAALRHVTARSESGIVWRAIFLATAERGLDLTTIEEGLVSVAGVKKIEARQTSPQDEGL